MLISSPQEIWTPDIFLWNQEESIQSSLADTYAIVRPNGDVFWVRLGRIKVTCKYYGLNKFPFDVLSCILEFGSWSRSGKHIHLRPQAGVGYTIGGSETAGQSYSEFHLTNISVAERVYPPFPRHPNDTWPVLLYEVSFQRASEPYVRGFLLLQMLLNMCAFACFWIPPYVGERMGLAITSLLAAVASDLAIASKLPTTAELNWLDVFNLISMIFSVGVVFQSAIVIYFHYYTGADLTPTYVKWMTRTWREKVQKKQQRRRRRWDNNSTTSNDNVRRSGGAGRGCTQSMMKDESKTERTTTNVRPVEQSTLQKNCALVMRWDNGKVDDDDDDYNDDDDYYNDDKGHHRNTNSHNCHGDDDEENNNKMDIPRDGSASILFHRDGADSKVGVGLSPNSRTSSSSQYGVKFAGVAEEEDEEQHEGGGEEEEQRRPSVVRHRRKHSRRISLPEHEVHRHSQNFRASLNNIRLDADDFRDEESKKNNVRWQIVASLIDEYSRLVFPVLYAIFLAIIFPRATQNSSPGNLQ